jgi:hypothetical protein
MPQYFAMYFTYQTKNKNMIAVIVIINTIVVVVTKICKTIILGISVIGVTV